MLAERYQDPTVFEQSYSERVERLLIDGIKQARSELAPARLGVGTGRAMAKTRS